MKNQPNNATVKDGLPTAEETLKRHVPPALYERGDCYVGHALDAIESHTSAHTATLLERVKGLEESVKEASTIIQVLQAYGAINPIKGVIYPEGTNEEIISKSQKWLYKNRLKS